MTATSALAHRLSAVLLTIASILVIGTPALTEVQIDYDLSRSRITTFSGLVELSPQPPDTNGLGAALARITLAGDVNNPQDGPAPLEDFELADLQIDENLFDAVSIQANAAAVQLGIALGTLSDERHLFVSPA